jgi:hypothetical protein
LLGLGEAKSNQNKSGYPNPRSTWVRGRNGENRCKSSRKKRKKHRSTGRGGVLPHRRNAAAVRVGPAAERGMSEPRLAAASLACGTYAWAPPPGRSTAARSPMGWKRAGEGAGSSAVVFHLSDLTLWTLMFWGGSVFGGSLEEGRGLRKGRGACCGWTPGGAAPHRRRQTRRPRGRNSRRRCCVVLRIGGNAKASRVCPGSWSLNTTCFSLGWMLTVDM